MELNYVTLISLSIDYYWEPALVNTASVIASVKSSPYFAVVVNFAFDYVMLRCET